MMLCKIFDALKIDLYPRIKILIVVSGLAQVWRGKILAILIRGREFIMRGIMRAIASGHIQCHSQNKRRGIK